MSTSPDEGRPTPEWEFLAALGSDAAVRSGQIGLAFGTALTAAAQALRSGDGLEAALVQVERQIALAAAAERGVFLGIIERSEYDTAIAPGHLSAGLCDLHVMAFELEQRLGRRERAKQHLLHAVATGVVHPLPRRHLVGLYVTSRDYRAAVDTLTNVVDDESEDATRSAMALIQLGDELAPLSPAQSTVSFQRAHERDPEGVGGVLAEYRLRTPDGARPSDEEIAGQLDTGLRLVLAGHRGAAIDLLVPVLAWGLYSPRAWFGLGMAYRAILPDFLLPPGRLSSTQRKDLSKAVQALRMAADLTSSEPAAHYEIALAELALGHHSTALASMNRYLALRPDDATALAYTGVIHFLLGDFRAATLATLKAQEQEPENALSNHMLLTLWELRELQ
ncbi:tetratricopeptide repeat protein [Streptomyces venetus]|uniref:tetratricopeptide repeat protein n=1 Tax=Streptomyces venetus TaxID=1701086 RepID=UPI003C2D7FE2